MRWYLIHRGQVQAVCFAPANTEERARSDALLAGTLSRKNGDQVLTAGAVDSVLLVVGLVPSQQRRSGEADLEGPGGSDTRRVEARTF